MKPFSRSLFNSSAPSMRKVFPTLVEFLELASVKEFHYEVGSSIDNVSWERALPNIKEELEAHIRQSKMLFFQTLVKDLFKLEVPLPPSIQTQLADGVEATLLVTTEAEIDLVLSRISAGIIMSGSNFLYYADAISYGPELYHQTSVRGSEQVTQAIVAAVSSAGLDLNTATVTSIMDLGEIFECRGCWHKANLNFITAVRPRFIVFCNPRSDRRFLW